MCSLCPVRHRPGIDDADAKGTGYYKVPSLRGLWYRGHPSTTGRRHSLEEMFDPDRLKGPGGARANAGPAIETSKNEDD
jgi:hypothetical protein